MPRLFSGLVVLTLPIVVCLLPGGARATLGDWPQSEADRPPVAGAGLFEGSLFFGEVRARQAYDANRHLAPTEPGQPTYVRGLELDLRYGLFRNFEVDLSVPFIITRRTETLVGAPDGRGLGRIQLGPRYQLEPRKHLWVAGGLLLLLPTTDPGLRPDPNDPAGEALKDNLATAVTGEVKRAFAQGAVSIHGQYLHTFANADDVDARRAPAPAWNLGVEGLVQASSRGFLALDLVFDRAGRTEIGGEAVPNSDAWTLRAQPRVGIHASRILDIEGRASGTLAGKNAPRAFVWSLGVTSRF